MTSRQRSRALAWILFTLGLGGTAVLVVFYGAGDVLEAASSVGWGIAAVAAWRAVPLFVSTLAWRVLLPRDGRPGLATLFAYRWIADSVNNLLPVAQVGGDLVRMRLSTRRGVPGPAAGASVVVDITAGLVAQVVFAFAGLALLFLSTESSAKSLAGLGAGVLLLVGMLAGLVWFQRSRGFRRLVERIAGMLGEPEKAQERGAAFQSAIGGAYTGPSFTACCVLRLIAWSLGAMEVWLALRFMGIAASPARAVILESLGQAAKTAGFLVPGGLGVQEGGYVFLGPLAGLTRSASLALSLVKRARELVTGLPGLAAWQIAEARLRARSAAKPDDGLDARSPRATRA